MSMTTVLAKVYIARVIGGAASPNAIDAANEALLRGYADWQIMRNWDYLLKDNSLTTVVTGVNVPATFSSSVTINAPSSGAFDFVNVGQSVTIAATDTAVIPAGTTISSFTRNSDGTIASITLSNGTTGASDTDSTLTFGAYMHITAGTNDYNLPSDFYEIYTARFITNSKRPLAYKRHREWDYTQWDQTVRGTPAEYTTYNPFSSATQNHGTDHFKFDVVPDQADDLFIRYYRVFNSTGTFVDVPDVYLYPFLDHCRARALEAKRAQENPQGYLNEQKETSAKAGESEEEKEDNNLRMKSQYEMGSVNNRPIVGNGDFWPTQY